MLDTARIGAPYQRQTADTNKVKNLNLSGLGGVFLTIEYNFSRSCGSFGFFGFAAAVEQEIAGRVLPTLVLSKKIESNDIEISNSNEDIPLISEHVPTHLKPSSNEDFGQYLAGLIDGNGSFGVKELRLAFNSLDASLAYYIKGRIGYGSVLKIKSKNASGSAVLKLTKREGLEKVINLVNGKLRVQFKLDCIDKQVLNVYKEPFKLKDKLHLNTSSDLNNY